MLCLRRYLIHLYNCMQIACRISFKHIGVVIGQTHFDCICHYTKPDPNEKTNIASPDFALLLGALLLLLLLFGGFNRFRFAAFAAAASVFAFASWVAFVCAVVVSAVPEEFCCSVVKSNPSVCTSNPASSWRGQKSKYRPRDEDLVLRRMCDPMPSIHWKCVRFCISALACGKNTWTRCLYRVHYRIADSVWSNQGKGAQKKWSSSIWTSCNWDELLLNLQQWLHIVT